jgi:O-antigen ligase/cytochrome c-type biogenesis protein CcmH/NrfG
MVLELGLYSVLFGWLGLRLVSGTFTARKPAVLLPLCAVTAAVLGYYLVSADPLVALAEVKRIILSAVAFLVVTQVITSARHRAIAAGAWISGSFLIALYGILQHTGGIGRLGVPQLPRVMATFGNPIFFAAYLVASIPVAVGYLFAARAPWVKFALALYCGTAGYAVYATQTRAAYVAAAAAAAVFIVLSLRTRWARITAFAVVVAVGVGIVSSSAGIWSRQQAHVLIWRDTVAMWLSTPWFGTGLGTFHLYFPSFASTQLKAIWPQGQFIVNDAHNEFLQTLAETGIVGFGLYAWLLAAFFLHASRTVRQLPDRSRFAAAGFTAAAAGILTQNFFSVDMRFVVSSVYLFMAMGFVESFSAAQYTVRSVLPATVRAAGIIAVAAAAAIVLPRLAAPYRAQHDVQAEPDFFDEKVLEPAKTVAELEALARQYPAQALVYEKLGWVHAKEKNWQAAIHNLEKAAALDPSRAGPLNNLGNIYFLQGQSQRAIENWQRSLAINPAQIDSKLNLATAYYHAGQLKAAADQINAVLQQDPQNKRAQLLLKEMKE